MMTRKYTILIIEDDSAMQDTLKEILFSDGKYKILTAKNGYEGLHQLNKHKSAAGLMKNKVDCIILDIKMPDMDGIEFLRRWRTIEGPGELVPLMYRIPVLFLSAYEDADKWGAAISVVKGMLVEYLKKPLREEELLDTLHRVLINKDSFGMQMELLEKRNAIPDCTEFLDKKKLPNDGAYSVLLVDDDPHILESLTEILEGEYNYKSLLYCLPEYYGRLFEEYNDVLSGLGIQYKDKKGNIKEGIIKKSTADFIYHKEWKDYYIIYKVEVANKNDQSVIEEEFKVSVDRSGFEYGDIENKSGERISNPREDVLVMYPKYKVVTAQNAAKASERLSKKRSFFGLFQKNKIDCIILDIKMPGKDGLTFLQEWRKKERFNLVPVILLSAYEDEEKWARATDVTRGLVCTYLKKPLRTKPLLDALVKVLDKKEAEVLAKRTREAGYSSREHFQKLNEQNK